MKRPRLKLATASLTIALSLSLSLLTEASTGPSHQFYDRDLQDETPGLIKSIDEVPGSVETPKAPAYQAPSRLDQTPLYNEVLEIMKVPANSYGAHQFGAMNLNAIIVLLDRLETRLIDDGEMTSAKLREIDRLVFELDELIQGPSDSQTTSAR